MPVFDLFSKRSKREKEGMPDVYSYDVFPQKLKNQIVHIIRNVIGQVQVGRYASQKSGIAYSNIHTMLCEEYGIFILTDNEDFEHYQHLPVFVSTSTNHERILDAIEVTFNYFLNMHPHDYNSYRIEIQPPLSIHEAIDDLNTRFKENAVGYQFESNRMIRLDSTYLHSEVIRPTLSLLSNKVFAGANEEYLSAHEHYRKGRNKECLSDCLKAFESTMKIICKQKKWAYNQNDTSKSLINICFTNGLIPSYMQNQFSSLRTLLESGIPTLRNKVGGHGQGSDLQTVDDSLCRYGLNLTGSNIIFLIDQSRIV